MKIKSEIKDYQRRVKVKLSYREKMNEKELEKFSHISTRVFLKPQLVKRKSIEYIGTIGISLAERFKKTISKNDFFLIMEQIVVMAQKLEEEELSSNYLILNTEHVFINESTKQLQFLYIPIEGMFSKMTILEFMEQIICCFHLDNEENDIDYASRFSFFLKNLQHFDAEMIEKCISKEDRIAVKTVRGWNIVPYNGGKTNKKQQYEEHNSSKEDKDIEDEKTGLLSENWQRYEPDDKDTIGLDDLQMEETGLLEYEKYPETEKYEDEEYPETTKFEDAGYPETEKYEDEEYLETGLL